MDKPMTQEEVLIQYIVNEIANELLNHYHEDIPQIYFREPRTLTYQEWKEKDIAVTYVEAIALIKKWVEQYYTKYGKVFLYTCRDNMEIGIEGFSPKDEEEEDLELFEEQCIPGFSGKIFYIGFD